ncbi:MAG: hypothetical protein KDK36_07780, partial [Leptospiraceae bacterium]|nr:hypothetical protein [Leptospiraceae bacterium]
MKKFILILILGIIFQYSILAQNTLETEKVPEKKEVKMPIKKEVPITGKDSNSKKVPVKKTYQNKAPGDELEDTAEEDPEDLLKKYAEESDTEEGIAMNPFAGEEFKPKYQIGGFMDFHALKAIPIKGSDDFIYKQFADSSIINEGLFYPMFPANTSYRIANINIYNTFHV